MAKEVLRMMREWFIQMRKALVAVYTHKQYYAYSFVFGLLVFSLNPLLRNYKLLRVQFSWVLMYQLIVGSPMTISGESLLLLILISLLSGMVMAFSIYVVKRQVTQGVKLGLAGVVLGILTPACPSCAIGLLGVLGLGGLLTVLPFKGLELGFLGIVLLIISLSYLARKVTTEVCILPWEKKKIVKKTLKK